MKRAVKFHFWWFLWFIIGIVNTFFQVSPLLLYWNQTCCFQQGIRCAKRLKNCRLTVNFSIIGCFLRVLEIRTTYVSKSAAYHNYLERSYYHHIRALFFFKHFNTLIFSGSKNWIHTKHRSAIIVAVMFYHWLHNT